MANPSVAKLAPIPICFTAKWLGKKCFSEDTTLISSCFFMGSLRGVPLLVFFPKKIVPGAVPMFGLRLPQLRVPEGCVRQKGSPATGEEGSRWFYSPSQSLSG